MPELDDVTQEFLVESHENLARLDAEMLELEARPGDAELLASVFRTIHTLKGTCGFLGFGKLESVAHAGENLLSKVRDGERALDAEVADALLALVDAVREMLASIEHDGAEGAGDYSALIRTLAELDEGRSATLATPPPTAPAPVASSTLHDRSIRVDVELLDGLMNLVGELVLSRNQLLRSGAARDPRLSGPTQRLDLVTSELQESVLRARLQPIASLWSKFPRVVRELARATGKRARLELHGQETELDRTLLEAIRDPLTHLLRNALDHGIETPRERAAAGKPEEGKLVLRAWHTGGHVHVELADDGAGIDLARVRARALERGLVAADAAERMSERELLRLIFLPGFSTASAVSTISGRGVGLDVVETNLERIGGSVTLRSTPGIGTTFELQVPLTLAILPGLIVRAGSETFVIPQSALLELVHLDAHAASTQIERVHGAPVHRLRGRLLPVCELARELDLGERTLEGRDVTLVVVQVDGRELGLVVDAVDEVQELVVKPLSKELRALGLYAGATVLGDGAVALILDVAGVAHAAGVLAGEHTAPATECALDAAPAPTRALLVCRAGGGRHALPLASVVRLEVLEASALEPLGGTSVVQYHGEILPLCALDGTPRAHGGGTAGRLQVVVCAVRGLELGVVVDEIVDIVEHTGALANASSAEVIAHAVTELVDLDACARRFTSASARERSEERA